MTTRMTKRKITRTARKKTTKALTKRLLPSILTPKTSRRRK